MTPSSSHPVLVGLGEILWDLLPAGRQLGGAPSNFACHAAALGADARVVSRVGNDALGRETLGIFRERGLGAEGVEVDAVLPTGTAGVDLAADGQPRFTIHEGVAWDALQGQAAGMQTLAAADAVCFGTLGQRTEGARAAIRRLVAGAPSKALRVFDVNLRQHYFSVPLIEESLEWSDVLKVNAEELARLGDMMGIPGDERARMTTLASRHGLRCVVCTRGAEGSLVWADGHWSDRGGEVVAVVDAVGAGDAFTAGLTLGLLAGWPLPEVHARAAALASFVCTQAGATPPVPEFLAAPYRGIRRRAV